MSFRDDVETVNGLGGAYRAGIQALTTADQRRLTVHRPRRLTGSVHIDAALVAHDPQGARWDYVVAHRGDSRSEFLHWIEVHPATSSANIDEVFAKLNWLIGWLRSDAARLAVHARRFVWVSTGSTGFRAGSPQSKRIANRGVYSAGRHYSL